MGEEGGAAGGDHDLGWGLLLDRVGEGEGERVGLRDRGRTLGGCAFGGRRRRRRRWKRRRAYLVEKKGRSEMGKEEERGGKGGNGNGDGCLPILTTSTPMSSKQASICLETKVEGM